MVLQRPAEACQPSPLDPSLTADDCEQGAEVLAALQFAACPPPPAQTAERRRPVAPISTASYLRAASACDVVTDSNGEGVDYRPRKVRVLPAASSRPASLLARRSYTWRGVSSRRAEKQQRQLDAQQQQQQRASPTHSSGSAHTVLEAAAVLPQLPPAAPAGVPHSSASRTNNQEGDRAFAALTTWLRQNIHRPCTCKKVVPFMGEQSAADGRWTFHLNPALCWGEVSADTRHRLRHLPAEAMQAFVGKYPSRVPADWRLKSQKYKAPGSRQTHLVLLEDLVLSLHAIYLQHEGDAAGLEAGCGSGAALSMPTVAIPTTTTKLASRGSNTLRQLA